MIMSCIYTCAMYEYASIQVYTCTDLYSSYGWFFNLENKRADKEETDKATQIEL